MSNEPYACESIAEEALLYLYGELTAEAEERLEGHLDACPSCGSEVEKARALRRSLDARSLEPSTALLADCRQSLMHAVERSRRPAGPMSTLRRALDPLFFPVFGLRRLAAAAALVAFGFIAARMGGVGKSIGLPGTATSSATPPAVVAGFSPDAVVSGITHDPSGQVRISKTSTEIVSGSPDDGDIQRLLLIAAADQANPGVRVESIEILKDHSRSAEVRKALLQALDHDPNPGVRLAALEGLQSFSADAETRQALIRALLADTNPGVRIQAIELLTQKRDEALVGVLQSLMQKEQNRYVLLRCRNALRDMNASVGAF